MVVLAGPPAVDRNTPLLIPTVDLSSPSSPAALAAACSSHGFAKLTSHGVPPELRDRLEAEAGRFFSLPPAAKDWSGPAQPLGYGSKKIGFNGDHGWLEYLLLAVDGGELARSSDAMAFLQESSSFRTALNDYTSAMRRLSVVVLDKIAEGLKVEPWNALSRMVAGDGSDQVLRLNRYPPCPPEMIAGVTGFGEHTDPQIISLLRSNGTGGLQIGLPDGRWLAVPSDPDAFFLNVGDCLQALTNGRLRSVKHRVVVTSGIKARLSTVFFAGPAPAERIKPLPGLMAEGEKRMYREFAWEEYKKAAYKTRLSDNRLSLFQL